MESQGGRKCELCQKVFKDKYNLTRHQGVAHEALRCYPCTQSDSDGIPCGKTFTRPDNLKTHMLGHANANQYSCSRCTKTYTKNSKLKLHIASMHSEGEAAVFKCPHCEHESASKWNLGQHVQGHTNEQAFPCDRCRFKTSTKNQLDKHVNVKHSPLPRQQFPCDQCDYLSPRETHLKAHKLKHAAGRPFSCRQCEKTFKLHRELLVHTRVHSGEGSLQCVPCEKTFVTTQLMKRHNKSVSHLLDPERRSQRKQLFRQLKEVLSSMKELDAVKYQVPVKVVENGKEREKKLPIGSNSKFLTLLESFPIRHQDQNWVNKEKEEQDFWPTMAQAKTQDRVFNQAMMLFHTDRCTEEWAQEYDAVARGKEKGKYVAAIEEVAKAITRRKTDLKKYCEMRKRQMERARLSEQRAKETRRGNLGEAATEDA